MKKLLLSTLALILSTTGVHMATAQVGEQSVLTREQAVAHLTQLIPVYQVSLTSAEQDQVITVCRQLQSTVLQDLTAGLANTNKKYLDVINNIDLRIIFTANALRQMSEDSSGLDLASFHMGGYKTNFVNSLGVYERSLEELLIIDCQVFPAEFVAGLEEARVRKRLVEASAQDIVDFIEGEVTQTLKSVEQRLESVEANR